MWMAEFCRRTGLTRDAVRFYERLGLLKPAVDRNNRRSPPSPGAAVGFLFRLQAASG